jgi:SPP1 gp7 family putative phage head morphogenesis protein
MKTYQELKKASGMLLDADGKIKPFNKFKEDVETIHKDYNERYLETEYGFAVHSSQMAAKWNDFEQDGDEYDIQYRTAADDRVRPEHVALNNTTLPKDDPFWDNYVPSLDWGCRCDIAQVRKNKYPESNSQNAQKLGETATTRIAADGTNKLAMFRFNSGKQMKVFPDKHPYFARNNSPQDVKQAQKIVEIMAKNTVKSLQYWAKENLQQKSVLHPDLNKEIIFSGGGIKEYLNQPHKHFYEKNALIKDIENVLKNAEYRGYNVYHKKNKLIAYSHIFETTINGEKSWLIARENNDGVINFYSVSDNKKVLSNLIKK